MRTIAICFSLSLVAVVAYAQKNTVAPPATAKSLVISFKDGHQETYSVNDISKIEFNSASAPTIAEKYPGRFRGRWKVATGSNGETFYITLDNHGVATKTVGAAHGTWVAVGDEARISWDDGWHDAIRRVGGKYEKFAYEPGRDFADQPSNVTSAVNTSPN